MSWKSGSTFGEALLVELCRTLNLDEHWRVDIANGFRWWPADFAQSIWCEPGVYHHATTVYRIHAETDVIRGTGRAEAFEAALEQAMDHTSMHALVFDAERDMYCLHSSLYATEENMQFLRKTCFAAAILQLRDACQLSIQLSRSLGAHPATSGHPLHGLRSVADPQMSSAERFFCPAGQGPSRWLDAPEWRETERMIEREAIAYSSDHRTCANSVFPWTATEAGDGIHVVVDTTEPHPSLGSGLHFTLTVPVELSLEEASHQALVLNQNERDGWHKCHMLGSWSCHEGKLAFRMFIPNVLYRPELLPTFMLEMANRALWVNEHFATKGLRRMHSTAE